jgi:hypothetical protein
MLGRIPDPEDPERLVSARLNPKLAAAASTIDVIVDSAKDADINAVFTEKRGGKKYQRGGGFDIMALEGVEEVGESVQERAAYLKALAMMAIYNGTEMAKAGWEGTERQRTDAKNYFIENYAPLYDTAGRLIGIIGKLADQVIVKTPVTTAMLIAGGVGATANFFKEVFAKYNEVGRAKAADLMSDERAQKAADAAVGSAKAVLQTTAVGAFVANQMGLLPVSAVLAAILWQIQASFATGSGRAYLVAGFYAWYKGQDSETKTAIKTTAKKYAADAQSAAASGAPAVKAAAKDAAEALGALLAKGSGATGTAFQAVANAVTRAGGNYAKESVVQGGESAALEGGAPAAAIAVMGAGGDAPPAPDASGGRRKTKKVKSKRRMTRRRKATKVMSAPVFVY